MRLGISTITMDINGDLLIDASPKSDPITYERRVSNTATLDGETVFNDSGFTPSDNRLRIKCQTLTPAQLNRLIYFVKNYGGGDDGKGQLLLSCADGVFQGMMNNLKPHKIPVTFDFLISRQVA